MSTTKFLRVDLPKTVSGKIELVNLIGIKHLADGAASPLVHIDGYDWNDLAQRGALVNQLHNDAEKSKNDAILVNEQRDINLSVIEKSVKASRDILLGAYSNNPRKLSEWGFKTSIALNSTASSKKVKVDIPRNAGEVLALADSILQKHTDDGASSILNVIQDYSWSVSGALIAPTVILNNEGSRLIKESEKAYELRDNNLIQFTGAIKATRTFLFGVYKNTPKTLGDWGFIVNDTPKNKPAALKKSTKKEDNSAVSSENTDEISA
jgi:hypothetical protein